MQASHSLPYLTTVTPHTGPTFSCLNAPVTASHCNRRETVCRTWNFGMVYFVNLLWNWFFCSCIYISNTICVANWKRRCSRTPMRLWRANDQVTPNDCRPLGFSPPLTFFNTHLATRSISPPHAHIPAPIAPPTTLTSSTIRMSHLITSSSQQQFLRSYLTSGSNLICYTPSPHFSLTHRVTKTHSAAIRFSRSNLSYNLESSIHTWSNPNTSAVTGHRWYSSFSGLLSTLCMHSQRYRNVNCSIFTAPVSNSDVPN